MRFMDSTYKKNHSWTIETSSGMHEIKLKMGSTARKPMSLYIDNKQVKTMMYEGSALIPQMEYKFSCDDETILFVLNGSQVDLVHNGMLVKRKIKYLPNEKLSVVYRTIIMALVISSISVMYILKAVFGNFAPTTINAIALFGIVMCLLITHNYMTSPFISLKKKKIYSGLMILWTWVLVLGIMLFLGYLGEWLSF